MARVRLTGWRPGLHKIGLTKLIRERAGLGLAEAKFCTDRCVDGALVTIEIADADLAETFLREARALGALAELAESPGPLARSRIE